MRTDTEQKNKSSTVNHGLQSPIISTQADVNCSRHTRARRNLMSCNEEKKSGKRKLRFLKTPQVSKSLTRWLVCLSFPSSSCQSRALTCALSRQTIVVVSMGTLTSRRDYATFTTLSQWEVASPRSMKSEMTAERLKLFVSCCFNYNNQLARVRWNPSLSAAVWLIIKPADLDNYRPTSSLYHNTECDWASGFWKCRLDRKKL